jgi:hypothetical protein
LDGEAQPLLATPLTVTTTIPVVAPLGTDATMLVALQFVGAAAVPLNFTVLAPWVVPKFAPVMVTDAPTNPDAGFTLVMLGAAAPFPPAEQPLLNSNKVMQASRRILSAVRRPEIPRKSLNHLMTRSIPRILFQVETKPLSLCYCGHNS